MTGRRTLFYFDARWPDDILQKKENHDVKAYFYPGTQEIKHSPEDPAKAWFTEEYFPGMEFFDIDFLSVLTFI
jgi:hypothetical protein